MSNIEEYARIQGEVAWLLQGPDGQVKRAGRVRNLITQVGDQMYAERALAISGAPAAPIGMKLGTGSTAVAKTGAGAAVVTYLAGSNLAFDATYPQSALNGSARRITYKCTYGPGVATSAATPITEAVIFNNTNADAASTAAQTIARAIVSPGTKDTGDTLTVFWYHDLLGA